MYRCSRRWAPRLSIREEEGRRHQRYRRLRHGLVDRLCTDAQEDGRRGCLSEKKKVAVISDTAGYGTASLNAYVPMLKKMGAEVVYQRRRRSPSSAIPPATARPR